MRVTSQITQMVNVITTVLKLWRTIIHFDKKTWHKISECEIDNKCSMLPGWTNVIYNKIWKQLKTPCCYSFIGKS